MSPLIPIPLSDVLSNIATCLLAVVIIFVFSLDTVPILKYWSTATIIITLSSESPDAYSLLKNFSGNELAESLSIDNYLTSKCVYSGSEDKIWIIKLQCRSLEEPFFESYVWLMGRQGVRILLIMVTLKTSLLHILASDIAGIFQLVRQRFHRFIMRADSIDFNKMVILTTWYNLKENLFLSTHSLLRMMLRKIEYESVNII